MAVSFAEVFEAHGQTLMHEIHTGLPAKVVTYDPVTNTLSCDVAVTQPFFLGDGEREYETHATMVNVPVQWPRFGGKVIRGLLEPGDWVWLAFSEASLAEWRTTGQVSNPVDARRLSDGYPFAMPGAFPDTKPMSPVDAVEVAAGALIIGEDGGDRQMIIGGTVPGVRFGKTAVSPIALSVAADAALTAIVAKLNELIAAYNMHIHPASAGTTSPTVTQATAADPPATTASTLVKSV